MLRREAEELRRREVASIIDQIREEIAIYGLTASDLGLGPKPLRAKAGSTPGGKSQMRTGKGRSRVKASTMYRDQLGNTWSGRGLQPDWLKAALQAGKRLDDFKA